MLTQTEADTLLQVRKWFVKGTTFVVPSGKQVYGLESDAPQERFIVDTFRGTIRLQRVTLQNRARTIVILARLDLNGAPHTNPDGEKIPCPHIHLFREGYDDKWAFPLDPEQFRDPDDLGQAFVDFCRLCSIELPESFQEDLL